LAIGSKAEDSLVDIKNFRDRLWILGCTKIRGDRDLFLVEVDANDIPVKKYVIARDGYDLPLALRVLEGHIKIAAVSQIDKVNGAVLVDFNAGSSGNGWIIFTKEKTMFHIMSLKNNNVIYIKRIKNNWIKRSYSLREYNIKLTYDPINVKIKHISVPTKKVNLYITNYQEKRDIRQELLQVLSFYIPFLIIVMPLIIIITVLIINKYKKGVSTNMAHR